MKRLRIHLPDELYAVVAALAKAERGPRRKVILDAIKAYVAHRHVKTRTADAFGLWSGQASATRSYAESIRAEWGD